MECNRKAKAKEQSRSRELPAPISHGTSSSIGPLDKCAAHSSVATRRVRPGAVLTGTALIAFSQATSGAATVQNAQNTDVVDLP